MDSSHKESEEETPRERTERYNQDSKEVIQEEEVRKLKHYKSYKKGGSRRCHSRRKVKIDWKNLKGDMEREVGVFSMLIWKNILEELGNGINKMTSFHKPILKATIGLQSLAIMARAVKLVPKDMKKVKIKKQPKKMVKGFTDILIGVGLIKPTARLVNSI